MRWTEAHGGRLYRDPELDALEPLCATANQNIAAALHAYEQAHDLVRENRARVSHRVIGAAGCAGRVSSNTPLRAATAAQTTGSF